MASSSPIVTDESLHESYGPEINVIAWVFTGIAIAVVALKLFTRTHITRKVGWDDFFIFLSLAFSIIAAAFVSYSVTLGFGRHTQVVQALHGPDRLVKTAYWQILGYPFNIGAFSFPNISIAILIVDILDPNPQRARFLYTMTIGQVVIALISVVLIFAQCSPTKALWDHRIPGAKCWSPDVFNDYNYFVSAYTTVTDIILAVVPVSVFWRLQMPLKTKLGICIMMGLTLLSAIVTIVKATKLKLFTDRTDPLFNVAPLVIWGLIEQNVVLVAACVPTLRPFFHRSSFRSRAIESDTDDSHNHSGSSFKFHSRRNGPSAAVWELALREEAKQQEAHTKGPDAESNNSRQGIWRTLSFSIGEDRDSENGRMNRKLKDIVPSSLRS